MAQDKKTAIDTIDWDDMANKLLATFNWANSIRANTNHSNDFRGQCAQAGIAAARTLIELSAELRAQREAADKDNFKIAKP